MCVCVRHHECIIKLLPLPAICADGRSSWLRHLGMHFIVLVSWFAVVVDVVEIVRASSKLMGRVVPE